EIIAQRNRRSLLPAGSKPGSLAAMTSESRDDFNVPGFGRIWRQQRQRSVIECGQFVIVTRGQRKKRSIHYLLVSNEAVTNSTQCLTDGQIFGPELMSRPLQVALQ